MFFRKSSVGETTVFGLDGVRGGELERLEERLLMAVNIAQVGDTLTITGDANDEVIHVADFGEGVRVTADEYGDGLPEFAADYYGIHNITINTGKGDDEVGVSDLTISGNLTINTGVGDDRLYVEYSAYESAFGFGFYEGDNTIYGNVSINVGAGNDIAVVADSMIGGSLSFVGGNGNDQFDFGGGGSGTFVYGDVSLDTGAGPDIVTLTPPDHSDLEIAGNLTIKTGLNDDFVVVFSTEGDIEVNGKTTIDLGAGDDFFGPGTQGGDNDVDFNGLFALKAGDGNDLVRVEGDVDFGSSASFDLGKGNDVFYVDGYDEFSGVDFLGDLSVLGGAHNDRVILGADNNDGGYTTFHYAATFDGGAGLNRLEVHDFPAVYGEFPVFKKFVVFQ